MMDDREREAVAPVTELELALEVGAPQVVRGNPSGQRRAARTMARPAAPLDQAMAVQHGMDGTFGRNPDVARQPADQQLADLARAPVRLVAFEPDDEGLELRGQLVGVADRPARAVAQGRKPVLFVAVENLVAGLAGDAELPAHVRHGFPVQQAGDKAQAFPLSTASTPPAKRRKVLPMCPVRSVTYVSGRSSTTYASSREVPAGRVSTG